MVKSFLQEVNIPFLENESLKNHTTFKVGGIAQFVAMPKTVIQLQELRYFLKENNINYYILGKGSNVIFKDRNFEGVIIKTINLQEVTIDKNTVTAYAGVALNNLCKTLLDKSLSGLEFCYGIPGNIGGSIYMNAGAYGGEICDALVSVSYLNEDNEINTIEKKDIGFSYRTSIFQKKEWVIISGTFRLANSNKYEMNKFMESIMNKRIDKQPIDKPSAGSSFKRPIGYFAAALIDECGLKGVTVGGAQISEKHAGFIINTGNASTADIITLAEKVEKIVYEKTGVELEKEMIIV